MYNATKALLAACLLAAVSCVWSAGNLIFCSEGSPSGFDPGQYLTGTDFDASAETVFNRLVQFQRGSTLIEPGLATAWSVSPDGLVYTFTLRPGVRFHTTSYFRPTRDFNADDVVFTFQRMLDSNNAFRRAYPTDFPYFNDLGLKDNIASVEKIDPLTVRFTLHAIDAAFLQDLAMSFASIQSAEYANQLLKQGKPQQINALPVGTGPFVFKRYQKDTLIRFVGNKQYWKPGEVKLDNLIFAITPDASVRYQKLLAGECQISAYPRPGDLALMQADPQLHVMSLPGFNVGYLAYNVLHSPLDKLAVRQALDMSINRRVILKAIYQGAGQIAVNPMPPTQWAYNATLKNAPYDVARAKALLIKAGYPDGFNLTLWAMPVQRPYNPNARLMAEMIQSDWARIGVRARIMSFEWGEYIKRAKAGEHDALLIGWNGDNADPDNWLGSLFSCEAMNGNNFSKWCYPPFEDLIQSAKRTTDIALRTRDYMKAQEIIKAQVVVSPIAHSTFNVPVSRRVVGFKISPFGLNSFYGVSVKP
jgi:dipeptide transport system substrate-binding protein